MTLLQDFKERLPLNGGLLVVGLTGLALLIGACRSEQVIVFATPEALPTATKAAFVFSTPEPLPTLSDEMCEIDWSWGGATLQIYGPGGQEVCDDFLAYGHSSFGLEFKTSSGTDDDEGVLCWLEGQRLVYVVWDEPSWEAGGEFCDFLAGFEQLP